MVWLRDWKSMHSETLPKRLRSRTRKRVHLLRLAQQFIAKLAWGATKTSSEDFVRPSSLAVVDFAPWCTMWDKSKSLTKPDNGDGLMRALTEGLIVRTKRSYARPKRNGASYSGCMATSYHCLPCQLT